MEQVAAQMWMGEEVPEVVIMAGLAAQEARRGGRRVFARDEAPMPTLLVPRVPARVPIGQRLVVEAWMDWAIGRFVVWR